MLETLRITLVSLFLAQGLPSKAQAYTYIAGKDELDDLLATVYSDFTDKTTCTPKADFAKSGHWAYLCRLEALGVDFVPGSKTNLNFGDLATTYFTAEDSENPSWVRDFYSQIRYDVKVSTNALGSDGVSYDRLVELTSKLASDSTQSLKAMKYWTSADGSKGLIEMTPNDIPMLKDNKDAVLTADPELLMGNRIQWDRSNSSAMILSWQSVNEAFNGNLAQNEGGWRRHFKAKIDSVNNTAEMAAISGNRWGTQTTLVYSVLRFYQNSTHTLLRKVEDATESGSRTYACVANGTDPTGSWVSSYTTARSGNCSFAPDQESEAFTFTIATTPTQLDLMSDTVGALWSLLKERK